MNRIEATDYYYTVSEAVFDNFKDNTQSGTSISINLVGSHFYLSHSVILNNLYNYGAIFHGNGNLLSMKYICLENNSGYCGSRYCDPHVYSSLTLFVNGTSERNNSNQHTGPIIGANHLVHFNFNNITDATTAEHSPWYYLATNQNSIIGFSQMANTISIYISSSNNIGSSFNLKLFNFINNSANQMNYFYRSGQITYTSCVFFFNKTMSIGSAGNYVECVSDGSVSHNSFTYDLDGNEINELSFIDMNLCYYQNEEHKHCKSNSGFAGNERINVLIIFYLLSFNLDFSEYTKKIRRCF